MLDLVHLRSFLDVAERGTVAAAADALGYTPPAVSQHLAKLEAALDASLFDRIQGRLSLTAAGRELVPLAHQMLDLEHRCRVRVGTAPVRPRVVVAGFASAIAGVVIPRLAALGHVAVVEIVEAEDADALRDLGLGAADVVLTQEYDGQRTSRNPRLRYTPVHTDRLTLVLPAAMSAGTGLDAVAAEPWLLNGSGTRCATATMAVLDAADITPNIAAVVADNTTLLDLVAAGAGVTVVPDGVIDRRRTDITTATHDLGVTRTILAVTRTAAGPAIDPVVRILAQDVTKATATKPWGDPTKRADD